MNKNIVLTITGQTCSGKSTLESKLCETNMFYKIISTTTRKPRVGERDGVDYFFVDGKTFKTIEMMESVNYGSTFYGASIQEFQKAFEKEQIPVVVVEPNGMIQINEKCLSINWTPINVFMDVSDNVKYRRMLKRFFQDAKNAIIVSSSTEFNDLINKYAHRLSLMSEVESDWPYIFDSESVNSIVFNVYEDNFDLNKAISKIIDTVNNF